MAGEQELMSSDFTVLPEPEEPDSTIWIRSDHDFSLHRPSSDQARAAATRQNETPAQGAAGPESPRDPVRVLEQNGRQNQSDQAPIADSLTREQKQQLVRETIDRICERCGTDDGVTVPLRIAIIGKHGTGKSSFTNSLAAAMSQSRWREFATVGQLRDAGPISIVNRRYPKCCNASVERYQRVLLPDVIDVPGLGEDADAKTEELLRLLFYGHIQEDVPLQKVYEDCRTAESVDDIRRKYSQFYPHMRIDRVIVVASAQEALPTNLLKAIHAAAQPAYDRPERRAVPIFGVLTKKDMVDTSSETFKRWDKNFKEELGLINPRRKIISNYCDDMDPNGHRTRFTDPDIDMPIVELLEEVVDDARKVINQDDRLAPSNTAVVEDIRFWSQNVHPMVRESLKAGIIFIMAWAVLAVVGVTFGASSGDTDLADRCRRGVIKDAKVCKLAEGQSVLSLGMSAFVAFIVAVVIAVTRRLGH